MRCFNSWCLGANHPEKCQKPFYCLRNYVSFRCSREKEKGLIEACRCWELEIIHLYTDCRQNTLNSDSEHLSDLVGNSWCEKATFSAEGLFRSGHCQVQVTLLWILWQIHANQTWLSINRLNWKQTWWLLWLDSNSSKLHPNSAKYFMNFSWNLSVTVQKDWAQLAQHMLHLFSTTQHHDAQHWDPNQVAHWSPPTCNMVSQKSSQPQQSLNRHKNLLLDPKKGMLSGLDIKNFLQVTFR